MYTPSTRTLAVSFRSSEAASGAEGHCRTLPQCPPPPPQPVSGTADPGVVKQDKSSRGSVDTTKTRPDPQRVRMCKGERPIGAAKGKQSHTTASCQIPPGHSEPFPAPPPPLGHKLKVLYCRSPVWGHVAIHTTAAGRHASFGVGCSRPSNRSSDLRRFVTAVGTS